MHRFSERIDAQYRSMGYGAILPKETLDTFYVLLIIATSNCLFIIKAYSFRFWFQNAYMYHFLCGLMTIRVDHFKNNFTKEELAIFHINWPNDMKTIQIHNRKCEPIKNCQNVVGVYRDAIACVSLSESTVVLSM